MSRGRDTTDRVWKLSLDAAPLPRPPRPRRRDMTMPLYSADVEELALPVEPALVESLPTIPSLAAALDDLPARPRVATFAKPGRYRVAWSTAPVASEPGRIPPTPVVRSMAARHGVLRKLVLALVAWLGLR